MKSSAAIGTQQRSGKGRRRARLGSGPRKQRARCLVKQGGKDMVAGHDRHGEVRQGRQTGSDGMAQAERAMFEVHRLFRRRVRIPVIADLHHLAAVDGANFHPCIRRTPGGVDRVRNRRRKRCQQDRKTRDPGGTSMHRSCQSHCGAQAGKQYRPGRRPAVRAAWLLRGVL